MNCSFSGKIISKYRLGVPISRGAITLLLFVTGLAFSIGLFFQLTHQDIYVEQNAIRYTVVMGLGVIITITFLLRTIIYCRIVFKIIIQNAPGLLISEGNIIFWQPQAVCIPLSDIKNVTTEPYDRLFGRAARVKIVLSNGRTRYIRCDILENSEKGVAKVILDLSNL